MNEQNPAAVEASIEEDTDDREQRRFLDVGFWAVTGGVALAVIIPFLVDPASAWDFWVRINELISLPTGVLPG